MKLISLLSVCKEYCTQNHIILCDVVIDYHEAAQQELVPFAGRR